MQQKCLYFRFKQWTFSVKQTCEPRRGGVEGGDSTLTIEVTLLRDELRDDTERFTGFGILVKTLLFIFVWGGGAVCEDFTNGGGTVNSILDGGNTVFSEFMTPVSRFSFRGNFGVFNIVAYPPISSISISPAVDKRKTWKNKQIINESQQRYITKH